MSVITTTTTESRNFVHGEVAIHTNWGFMVTTYDGRDTKNEHPFCVVADHVLSPNYFYHKESLSHQDELIFVIDGEMVLSDALGEITKIGEGSVIRLSEKSKSHHEFYNSSDSHHLRMLRITMPLDKNSPAREYETKHFSKDEKRGRWRLIASDSAGIGSLTLRPHMNVYATLLRKGDSVRHILKPGRLAWVQPLIHVIEVNGQTLEPQTALKIRNAVSVDIVAKTENAEVLLVDMADSDTQLAN